MTKAIILSGGWGTRLRPLTCTIPKTLIPVGNRPVIERQMLLLKKAGINEIVLAVSVMSDYLNNYFGNGEKLKLKLHYTDEKTPMGTAGALKLAEEYLGDDNFFMVNGDVILNFDFKDMLNIHNNQNKIGTIASRLVDNPTRYGVLIIDEKTQNILEFLEKERFNLPIKKNQKFPVNAGIYILEPEIFSYIQPYKKLSLERDVFPILATERKLSHYTISGIWKDIGLPNELLEGNILLMKEILKNNDISNNNLIESNANIDPSVKIKSPVNIGENVIIEQNCVIGPNAIIGHNVNIGVNCEIKETLIFNNVNISENTKIEKTIIADNCYVQKNAILKGKKDQPVILSSYVHINENIKLIASSDHPISICHHEVVKEDIK